MIVTDPQHLITVARAEAGDAGYKIKGYPRRENWQNRQLAAEVRGHLDRAIDALTGVRGQFGGDDA